MFFIVEGCNKKCKYHCLSIVLCEVNNYIVRSYRDVSVEANIVTKLR